MTTPKFPSPLLSAHSRSGFSLGLAWMRFPAAVMRPAENRISIGGPWARVSHPNPSPSVNPAIPVADKTPTGTANPGSALAASMSPQGCSCLCGHGVATGVNDSIPAGGQIQNKPIFGCPVTGTIVPAAADCDGQIMVAGKANPGRISAMVMGRACAVAWVHLQGLTDEFGSFLP